jgi:thymidylate synthase (FAD)
VIDSRVVLDRGELALDSCLADDLSVANAARVSFNKQNEIPTVADEGLINFLMKNRHGTPFEHGVFRFIVKCPLFVAREWHRHRIGHSYNEVSGRYSEIEPEFYIPAKIRTQVGKPGAYTFEPADEHVTVEAQTEIEVTGRSSFQRYQKLLKLGVAKEQARLVLPVSTYTKFYWTCNPRSLMHFLSLRNSEYAQWEIRQYAEVAELFFRKQMPITANAFVENGRVAP